MVWFMTQLSGNFLLFWLPYLVSMAIGIGAPNRRTAAWQHSIGGATSPPLIRAASVAALGAD